MTKILETLAVIRAEGHIPLSEIITAEGAHLGRNTTAVLITSTDEKDWTAAARDLCQRGIRVIAVLMDCHSFGQPHSNVHIVEALTLSGISTYLVREGDDLAQSLQRPHARGISLTDRLPHG